MTDISLSSSPDSSPSLPILHRAPWVFTADSHNFSQNISLLEDGAVLCAAGRIQAVGRYKDLKAEFVGTVQEHQNAVLLPPLVNAHAHLELSFLAELGKNQTDKGGDITDWIRRLITLRMRFTGDDETVSQRNRLALAGLHDSGCGCVADTGNRLRSASIAGGQKVNVLFMLELFGLSKSAEKKAMHRLQEISGLAPDPQLYSMSCVPHAPYSAAPGLIMSLKEWTARRQVLFSIHVAESEEENEFLLHGTGSFRKFLQERGEVGDGFAVPGMRPIQYLESLGVLDSRSLCVHAVHADAADAALLARRKAKVCLCPGSNRMLDVGRAPLPLFLASGILPALGTDSLASNTRLNLWQEMRMLRDDHPGVEPAWILAMATKGGAEALGVEEELGILAPGRQARMVSITVPGELRSQEQALDFLTGIGHEADVYWVD